MNVPKRLLTGVVLNRTKDRFYCFRHHAWYEVQKLLVCDVRGCLWCKEHYVELQSFKRRQRWETEDGRRGTAGLGAAG
jgi:hypothetical protein